MADRDAIVDFLDDYLDIAAYPDYLPVGLQVPGAANVSRVVSGVSASLELFRRAADADAQMLLVHHGLFWKSDPRRIGARQKERLRCLFDHDLSLVAYHLALDAHPEVGNNALICDALELDQPARIRWARGAAGRIHRPSRTLDLARAAGRARARCDQP